MWRCWGLAILVWLASGLPAGAAPLDAALQAQLLDIYARYNQAIAAGKLPDALALRSAGNRAEMQKELKTAKDRTEFLSMARAMLPDSVVVQHASLNAAGQHARLVVALAKTIPPGRAAPDGPPPGSTQHAEATLGFVQQGGKWLFDEQIFGPDPTKIAACPDQKFEPESAYDLDRTVTLGGPIARVEFQADHTLVVVRVVDEENCAFLPNREELVKHGLDVTMLVPYAIVEIEGAPHRTDKQKVLVSDITVREED